MLVLFETPAGYALFKVLDKAKVKEADGIMDAFATPESAASVVKLKAFSKFADSVAALNANAAICEGTLDENLAKFLKESVVAKDISSKLAVADPKLGSLIKDSLNISCVAGDAINELMRGIRSQMDSLLAISEADKRAMRLGLSHSLARYKLKFSADKVDVMIIQAISLLDELDKELNTYAMRVREWYGWHFPEMGRIVIDNILYAKTVRKMGVRTHAATIDLSDVLPEETEKEMKAAAEVSMGTELAEEDINNIQHLAEQVISIAEYRSNLFEYLKNRMAAIAPNLTVMVGELVGARLIAHAGSLISLAKHPASTVQILGAEKALFRALKTKHDTPKYGLIYHASLVGQAAPKLKGKISRVLAAKAALAVRMDALGDTETATIGFTGREKVERRLQELEGGKVKALSGTAKGAAKEQKVAKPVETKEYNSAADSTMADAAPALPLKDKKKSKKEEAPAAAAVDEEAEKAAKKAAKKAKRKAEEEAAAAGGDAEAEQPKKKKKKAE